MPQPVVLDVDGSVGPLPGRLVLPLREYEERLRFGCSLRRMQRFARLLDHTMPATHGTVFLGSGDFHHLTWPLVARLAPTEPLDVVVLDNHPDNMRFPFGVHCGSWVRRVAQLAHVRHVHVVGITSADIGRGHAWENYREPLRSGKLTYWSNGVDVAWAHQAGLAAAFRSFATPAAMVDSFLAEQARAQHPVYLSIDKDVFAPWVARTNWDQGTLDEPAGLAIVRALRPRVVASDITGEISSYRYRTWWKRWLSAMDGQPDVPSAHLEAWQAQQHRLNLSLLGAMAGAPVALPSS